MKRLRFLLEAGAFAAILAAASDTVREAGGTVAGGHTIRNPEPVFGLAVQGTVHPDRVFRKAGARPGDVAVLSKPLGTGLVTAAGTEEEKRAAIDGMRKVNRSAAAALRGAGGAASVSDERTGGRAGVARLGRCGSSGSLPGCPGAKCPLRPLR